MIKIISNWITSKTETKSLNDFTFHKDAVEIINKDLHRKIRALSRRSIHIREIDSGSCNACELEIISLTNPVYDIERFGVHFVASPRHADMLLVTGPVTRNMELALKKAYEAASEPKIVVAVGDCAMNAGIFKDSYAVVGGVEKVIPVDAYISGCPPRPQELLYGVLRILERI